MNETQQVESTFRLQVSPYFGWDVVQTSLLDAGPESLNQRMKVTYNKLVRDRIPERWTGVLRSNQVDRRKVGLVSGYITCD